MADLTAVVEAIRHEASLWEEKSTVPETVSGSAKGLRLGHLDAGLFQPIIDVHDQVCDFVEAQCSAGSVAMQDVGTALRTNATAYEDGEAESTASVESVELSF